MCSGKLGIRLLIKPSRLQNVIDFKHKYYFFPAMYYTVHWLAMSNSFVNPIIYGFLNDSFRVSVYWQRF